MENDVIKEVAFLVLKKPGEKTGSKVILCTQEKAINGLLIKTIFLRKLFLLTLFWLEKMGEKNEETLAMNS